MWKLGALLAISLAIAAYNTYSGTKDYAKTRRDNNRVWLYRRWIMQSWLIFAAPSVAFLLTAGAPHYLVKPIAQGTLADERILRGETEHILSIIAGLLFSSLLVAVAALAIRRRGTLQRRTQPPQEMLLPTNRHEKRLAIILCLTAGITEELFFRALLPGLLFLITGNAVVAIAVSVAVFGLAHLYAGWTIVVSTAYTGLVLFILYASSGTIIVPMIAHALLDVRALLFNVSKKTPHTAHR